MVQQLTVILTATAGENGRAVWRPQHEPEGHHGGLSVRAANLREHLRDTLERARVALRPWPPIVALDDQHRAGKHRLLPQGFQDTDMASEQDNADGQPGKHEHKRVSHRLWRISVSAVPGWKRA
jgi:phosphate-selective porin